MPLNLCTSTASSENSDNYSKSPKGTVVKMNGLRHRRGLEHAWHIVEVSAIMTVTTHDDDVKTWVICSLLHKAFPEPSVCLEEIIISFEFL